MNLYDKIPAGNGKTTFAGTVFIKRRISKLTAMKYAINLHRAAKMNSIIMRSWLVLEILSFVLWIASDLVELDTLALVMGIYFFFVSPVLLFLVFLIRHLTNLKERRAMKSLMERAYQELGYPEDADELEMIYPLGGDAGGWVNGNHKGLLCHNFRVRMFLSENNLCLADFGSVMEIPLTSLHSISPTPIKGRITRWLHKNGPRSRKFRKYKVKYYTANNYIILFHEIQIHAPEGNFSFCIPNYELEKFSELTKL